MYDIITELCSTVVICQNSGGADVTWMVVIVVKHRITLFLCSLT